MVGKSAAAADQAAADPAVDDAQVFQQGGQIGGRGGDKDPVTGFQDEVASGGDTLAVPQDRTDQNLAFDDVVHIDQRYVAQLAVWLDPQLHDLGTTLGEAVQLQETGVLQQTLDFSGSVAVRVDDQRKTKGIPQLMGLLRIFGVADPADGVDLLIQTVGNGAAKQVGLIGIGNGNDQVGIHDACLIQRFHGSAVAADAHDVVAFHALVQNGLITVHQRNVMTFGTQQQGKGSANHAATGDDNVHSIVLQDWFKLRPL